jgi:Uma2 family endonuclease
MVITTSPLVKTYTLQEFWGLPEPADHCKLELIKGVLYMTPPPDYPHNEAAAALIALLRDAIRDHGYAGRIYPPRAAIWVTDNTYLEPDLMYISDALRQEMTATHWTKADLVIEICSPSTARYDRTTKADTYRAMGVREMWLVDPAARTVDVLDFVSDLSLRFEGEEVLRSRALPGAGLPVHRIFAS